MTSGQITSFHEDARVFFFRNSAELGLDQTSASVDWVPGSSHDSDVKS